MTDGPLRAPPRLALGEAGGRLPQKLFPGLLIGRRGQKVGTYLIFVPITFHSMARLV